MCSSPRGSTSRRRYAKKTFSQSEYEEYASMVRKASAIYDRIEKEKAQKRKLIANQHSVPGIKQKEVFKDESKAQSGIFSCIKAFLLSPVF